MNAGILSLGQINPSNESSTVRIDADATLDLACTGTGTLRVTSGWPGFPLWITGTGLTGPEAAPAADPDNDGLPNLVEFVLGGEPNPVNPTAASNALAPTITQEPSHLVFTYRRSNLAANAPGLMIRLEHGSTLAAWSGAVHGQNGVTISTINDGFSPGIDRVEVRMPRPQPESAPIFARLAVALAN